MSDEPSRNDPCPCGSGRKYKNCCLEKDGSALTSKLGVAGLIIAVLVGLWFLGNALSSENSTPDCPPGERWSEAHQHCH